MPKRLLLLLSALFPLAAVSVHSGGSIIYTLLVLPALFYAWPAWNQLAAAERSWFAAAVALFVLAAVSLFYTVELENGVQKLERFFRLATVGLLYLFMLRTRVEAGRLFLLGVAAAALSLGLQALYQIHVLKMGVSIGLYHKIVFGDMALLTFAVLLAAWLTLATRNWHYLLLGLAMVSAAYASLMSFTRASWLLFPVLFLLLAFLFRRSIKRKVWLALAGLALCLVLVLSVWQPQRLKQGVELGMRDLQTFMQNPGIRSSWGDRLNMWRNSLIIWSGQPVLGTGLGDFNHDSRQLVEQGVSYSENIIEYGHAHSIYLDVLATLGVTGLALLLLALVVLPWRWFYRAWCKAHEPWGRFYALAGLMTVFAFAFFGLTEGWTSRNPFVNPYVVYLAVFASSFTLSARAVSKSSRSHTNSSENG